MSRLPWTNPGAPRATYDEGGMEHLETDVMRFMAILAFCLVAIFALVQSLPLSGPDATAVAAQTVPAPAVEPARETRPAPAPSAARVLNAAAAPTPPAAQALTEPVPGPGRAADQARLPVPAARTGANATPAAARTAPTTAMASPAPERIVLVMPAPSQRHTTSASSRTAQLRTAAATGPSPVATAPSNTPLAAPDTEPPPSAPSEAQRQRGFTLRFDSDDALRQLIARDAVGLYAFAHDKAWRVMLVEERLSFRPAQVPPQFHEMTARTVPDDVVRTLRRLVSVTSERVTWGVTLPAATSRRLAELLAAHDAGGLVIDADGDLHLERES